MNTPDQETHSETQTAAEEPQPETALPARGHLRKRTQQPRTRGYRRRTATAALQTKTEAKAAEPAGTAPWPRPLAGLAIFSGSLMALVSALAGLFFLLVFISDEPLGRGVVLATCLLLLLFAAVFFIGAKLALAGRRHWLAHQSGVLPAAKKPASAAAVHATRYASAAEQKTAAAFRQPESTGFAAFAFWSIALLLCLVLTAAALLLTLMSLVDPERGSGFTLFLSGFVMLFGTCLFFAVKKTIQNFRIYNAAQQQSWKV